LARLYLKITVGAYPDLVAEDYSGLPSLPLRLSAAQIVGFADPDDGEWSRLRVLQYRDLHKNRLTRLVGNSIGALVAFGALADNLPLLMIGAWLLALALALGNVLVVERELADIDRRLITRREFKRHAYATLGLVLVWSLPLLAFTPFIDASDHYLMITLVAMLLAGSSSAMTQAPLSTIIWAVVGGVAAVVSLVLKGDYLFACASVAFCLVMSNGTLAMARTFLTARIAEAGVAEKDEVVSLLLREFEEHQADWLWQIDTQRRVKAASPRFAYALGLDAKDVDGKLFMELLAGANWGSGDLAPSLHELAERLKRRDSFANLVVQVDVPSGRRWWEISGTPIFDESGSYAGFRGVGSDVTEQRESSEKIAYLARYDTLTGLPNRLMLTEGLAEALRYSAQWKSRCAFLMIDLDRFKSVNDSLGHHIGDRLLAQVSQRLQTAMTENEQVGRLGGDEFAVVIRDASRTGHVDDVAERIVERHVRALHGGHPHAIHRRFASARPWVRATGPASRR
jgi:diguanylate cyclase (GGDEF)-like protein/PAS domain S-box-containing protein